MFKEAVQVAYIVKLKVKVRVKLEIKKIIKINRVRVTIAGIN